MPLFLSVKNRSQSPRRCSRLCKTVRQSLDISWLMQSRVPYESPPNPRLDTSVARVLAIPYRACGQQHPNISAHPPVPTRHRTSDDNSNDNGDVIMTTTSSIEQLGSAHFQALFKSAVPHAQPSMYHCYWRHNAPFRPRCLAQPCVISRLSRRHPGSSPQHCAALLVLPKVPRWP